MVIISASLEHCRLFVCFFYWLKAPRSVKSHSLPLSAASQARTNHCHWALSDRTDARRWGEITKTRVGVAFGLFFSSRKEQKKHDPHVTLLNIGATEGKRCSRFFRPTILPVILYDPSAMDVPYAMRTRRLNVCKLSHRGARSVCT